MGPGNRQVAPHSAGPRARHPRRRLVGRRQDPGRAGRRRYGGLVGSGYGPTYSVHPCRDVPRPGLVAGRRPPGYGKRQKNPSLGGVYGEISPFPGGSSRRNPRPGMVAGRQDRGRRRRRPDGAPVGRGPEPRSPRPAGGARRRGRGAGVGAGRQAAGGRPGRLLGANLGRGRPGSDAETPARLRPLGQGPSRRARSCLGAEGTDAGRDRAGRPPRVGAAFRQADPHHRGAGDGRLLVGRRPAAGDGRRGCGRARVGRVGRRTITPPRHDSRLQIGADSGGALVSGRQTGRAAGRADGLAAFGGDGPPDPDAARPGAGDHRAGMVRRLSADRRRGRLGPSGVRLGRRRRQAREDLHVAATGLRNHGPGLVAGRPDAGRRRGSADRGSAVGRGRRKGGGRAEGSARRRRQRPALDRRQDRRHGKCGRKRRLLERRDGQG